MLIWAATGVFLVNYFIVTSECTHHEPVPARTRIKAIMPIHFHNEPAPIR